MAKHQVFLVHGMGGFEKGWSLGVQQLLRDAYAQYAIPKAMGFDNDFQFVEVSYDDIFEDLRKLWHDNAQAASAVFTSTGLEPSAVAKLISLADGATGDDFFRTHVLDVAMCRFLKQINERLSVSLTKQILDRLNAFPQNDVPAWSVISHSLGTAVTTEALHAMFTQPVNGTMLGGRFKPDFLFMVANVSRILWNRGGDVYASEVRPHSIETRGMCFKYCTYAHALDPFLWVAPFDRPPARWFPDGATQDALYEHVEIGAADVQEFNVHGLTHYLSHPDVHASIFRTLLGAETFIAEKEVAAARKKWKQQTLAGAKLTEVKGKLTAVQAKQGSKWTALIGQLFEFRHEALKRGIDVTEGEQSNA
jgi:hypothetical protein